MADWHDRGVLGRAAGICYWERLGSRASGQPHHALFAFQHLTRRRDGHPCDRRCDQRGTGLALLRVIETRMIWRRNEKVYEHGLRVTQNMPRIDAFVAEWDARLSYREAIDALNKNRDRGEPDPQLRRLSVGVESIHRSRGHVAAAARIRPRNDRMRDHVRLSTIKKWGRTHPQGIHRAAPGARGQNNGGIYGEFSAFEQRIASEKDREII